MASQPRDRPVLSGRDTLPATSLSLQPREEGEEEEDLIPCLGAGDMGEGSEGPQEEVIRTIEQDMATINLEEVEVDGEVAIEEGSEETVEEDGGTGAIISRSHCILFVL